MAEGKKSVADLRRELRTLMAGVQVAPCKLARGDLERMISVYSTANEKVKTLPPAEKGKTGRKKAMEVEAEGKDGIAVPKKLDKPKTAYAEKKEQKAKATIKPGKLDDDSDSGTGSESEAEEKKAKVSSKKVEKAAVEPTSAPAPAPAEKKKRVISPEHLAKMKAAREAKKAAGDAAKPKKDNAPPDAPSKKEKPVKEKDDSSQYIKLPVFNLG